MIRRQVVRYAVIGVLLNTTIYTVYLFLTSQGMAPRWAMTLTYGAGVCNGFMLNKRITFENDGPGLILFLRYVIAYAAGYLVNLIAILTFEDWWRLPHQFVQAAMIFTVAILLFILQKFWVFARSPAVDRSTMTGTA